LKQELLCKFLPMSKEEMDARAWSELDILFVSGDAYVDHPSFGIPLLARFLENNGFRVGIVAQPQTAQDLLRLGTPRLFVGIGTGVVDSMVNNYTANKRKRSDDVYSEGGKGGLRPDYAGVVFAKYAKEIFPNLPIIGGGVEIALRRLAHYDYWQNKVVPSILADSPFDLIAYGMAEKQSLLLARQLDNAKKNASTNNPNWWRPVLRKLQLQNERGFVFKMEREDVGRIEEKIILPSFEEVRRDKKTFSRAMLYSLNQINPYNAKTLIQFHKEIAIVVTPPGLPISEKEMDEIYDLPFTKEQHWSYKEKIPGLETVKNSITINRGCFGGCSFCALTQHQGKFVQSRSEKSILEEIKRLTKSKHFTGIISDLGGPTANMYKLQGKDLEMCKKCYRPSCLHPDICENMDCNHSRQVDLLRQASSIEKVRRIFIASGVRYDLAMRDENYLRELISKHVGGHLKVAPEHTNEEVLNLMRKPSFSQFVAFMKIFEKISSEAEKEQYIVPYFISSFPGSTPEMMEKISSWLKQENWQLQQVQAFIPLPMTLASAMYWTQIDPYSKKEIFVAKGQNSRNKQRDQLQAHRISSGIKKSFKQRKRSRLG